MTNFYLDTHTDKAGECAIRVSVRARSKRLMTSIGYSISPELWSGSQVVVGTAKHPVTNAKGIPAATINARIAAITAAFTKIEATPGAASLDAFRNALNAITGRVSKADKARELPEVLAAFDEFIKEESKANLWAAGTLECWHAFRGHLQQYKAQLSFDDLNDKGLAAFVDYLRTRAAGENLATKARKDKDLAEAALSKATTKQAKAQATAQLRTAEKQIEYITKHPEGLEEKTAQKHFHNLKWFLKWCIRKGYCNQLAIEQYRPKFKITAKPVIFLTRPELLKLYSFEIPANGTIVTLTTSTGEQYTKKVQEAGALAKTRDLFCLCAFTSLRYSDMAALRKTNITGDSIVVTTKKTHDRLTIPLNDYSRAILNKYADYRDPRGLALPVISNQKMNDYIKDLCELCGFNEPITKTYYRGGERVEEVAPKWQLVGTHAARRTFICYALTKGIPPQIVMKWTGHSDYKAMKPYIDIAGADAEEAMKKMND